MTHVTHNPQTVPPPQGRYAQAVEVRPGARYLFISGQVGMKPDGTVPTDFNDQCHVAYQNIMHILEAAGMNATHLVKLTVFLTQPYQSVLHAQIRREYLGDHMPASTAVVVQTLNPAWHLEIEAVAAADA